MRFKVGTEAKIKFYQLPKMLFKGKYKNLSNNARVIYSFILDRLSLSMKSKMINERGELYVSLKRKSIMYLMGINKDTVAKNIQELCDVNLIDDVKVGKGKSNQIYPHQIEDQPFLQIDYNTETMSDTDEIEDEEDEEDIDKFVYDISSLKKNIEYFETIEFYEYHIKADSFHMLEKNKTFLFMYKAITKALFEVFLVSNKTASYNILKVERDLNDVRQRLYELRAEHVQNVTSRFIDSEKPIKNKNGYIVSCLYNEAENTNMEKYLAEATALRDIRAWAETAATKDYR